jgi:hypothetical protein
MSEAPSISTEGDDPPSAAQPKVRHREYCRRLLAQGTLTPREQSYLVKLLHRHPHADRKIGPGVRRIGVQTVPSYRTKGFYVERVDGTRTDFSYLRCLSPKSPRQDVLSAMRRSVSEQILAFKRRAFDGRCEVTGQPLDWHDADVDHADPLFNEIADAFAEVYGGYEHIKLLDSIDNGIGRELHPDVAAHFRHFHEERAVLRIVSPQTNRELYQEWRRGR